MRDKQYYIEYAFQWFGAMPHDEAENVMDVVRAHRSYMTRHDFERFAGSLVARLMEDEARGEIIPWS